MYRLLVSIVFYLLFLSCQLFLYLVVQVSYLPTFHSKLTSGLIVACCFKVCYAIVIIKQGVLYPLLFFCKSRIDACSFPHKRDLLLIYLLVFAQCTFLSSKTRLIRLNVSLYSCLSFCDVCLLFIHAWQSNLYASSIADDSFLNASISSVSLSLLMLVSP